MNLKANMFVGKSFNSKPTFPRTGLGMLFDIVGYILFGFLEDMIPVKVRRRLCMAGLLMGAALAGAGWMMMEHCTSCSTDSYDGLLELLMMASGAFLMFVSLLVWPTEDDTESQLSEEARSS